jgi:hypothetical protein
MKKAVVITVGNPGPDASSLPWREAFAQGLRRRGWNATVSTAPADCDLMVMWGVRRNDLIARQKKAGGQICILERGYIGDRFSWTSVSFGGGLNGRGEFRGPDDPSRFEENFAYLMKPWRLMPGYALIMGQVIGDQSIRGVDIDSWYAATVQALTTRGLDVRFRPHPRASRQRIGAVPCLGVQGTLAEALAGAAFTVTYNSNSGVDSALAGVPTIAMDRGSMAWDVSGHALDEIIMPDRAAWACKLAWSQWTKDEFASGFCAEMVGL